MDAPRRHPGEQEAPSAWLAAIVDFSDDAIVSKTLDGVITSWNPGAERIFGWTVAEAVGRHITLIIPPELHWQEDEVLARLVRGERIDHFETVRVTRDGRLVDVSITVSPVKDPSGRIVGASKIARNITERRELEQERARALSREREARRQAEALNRAKDHLLMMVSHELRTPLNSIFGWARLLQGGDLGPEQQERAINAIVRSASAQARLVEDLLDLSRIATGRLRLDLASVDLNAVVEAALEAVRPAAAAKDLALVTALERPLDPLVGAADRLQQVVWNLVMNAVKFTAPDGRVEVVTRRRDRAVEIVVTDTGEGIAPDVLPHVFEPFHQEDSSSTRAHGGIGLGLTLVRQLVELHGGEVRADSAGKGKGATFTVTLPTARSASEGPPGGARLRGVKVLVVAPDADVLAMALRGAGAEVRTAPGAFRAHEVIVRWPPAVVVTDIEVPGEDGLLLGRTLRAALARRGLDIRLIGLAAIAPTEPASPGEDAGFDRYLERPLESETLISAVAEAAQPSD